MMTLLRLSNKARTQTILRALAAPLLMSGFLFSSLELLGSAGTYYPE